MRFHFDSTDFDESGNRESQQHADIHVETVNEIGFGQILQFLARLTSILVSTLLGRDKQMLGLLGKKYILSEQMLRSMIDMIISKRSYSKVAMIMVRLISNVQVLVVSCLLGSFRKILREQLALLVKVVARTLMITQSESEG